MCTKDGCVLTDGEAKELAASLTREEAIALVRCESQRSYGKRQSREDVLKVCNSLREKDLIEINSWRVNARGRLVVKALT
jgi:hypothetical protein